VNYNQVMEDIGDVIDAAGVAVIVVGMLISAGGAVVELRRHETGIYRHFRQQLGYREAGLGSARLKRYGRCVVHFDLAQFDVHDLPPSAEA